MFRLNSKLAKQSGTLSHGALSLSRKAMGNIYPFNIYRFERVAMGIG